LTGEHVLAPILRAGHIVLIDNLSAHHSKRVEQPITACGCELRFLPGYSPAFPPIEPAFARLKRGWRKAGARSVEELYEVVSASLSSITTADARSFFVNCGFRCAWHRINLYEKRSSAAEVDQRLPAAARFRRGFR